MKNQLKRILAVYGRWVLRLKLWLQAFFPAYHRLKLELGSKTLLYKVKITNKGQDNHLVIGKACMIRKLKIVFNGTNNLVRIGDQVKCYDFGVIQIQGDNCTLEIGAESTIGNAKLFLGESDTRIQIGEDCMLSRGISISTSDFHSIIDQSTGARINRAEDVVIGSHVWIGNSVLINKGARVGHDCVVAARSLLTKTTYPAHSIIGGSPARVIKSDISWLREKI